MRRIIPYIMVLALSQVAAKPTNDWNSETKLWLGRSCAGEAGIHAHDECMGIAWVYATRAQETGMSLLKLIKKYSAAVKPHEKHRRPWLFELTLDGCKPEHFPRGLKWRVHRYYWMNMLKKLDQWARGEIENPVPCANHFGGAMDTPHVQWIRIRTPLSKAFKNRFYREVRVVQGKPASSALICNSDMNGNR